MTATEWAVLIGTGLGAASSIWYKLNSSVGNSKDGSLKDAVLRLEGKVDTYQGSLREDVSSIRRDVSEAKDIANQALWQVEQLREDRAGR